MAEQNITKLIKRLKGLDRAKRVKEIMKFDDEYLLFDLVEEFAGLTGIEDALLEAALKMDAQEFLEAYRGRLECAIILSDIKDKNYEVQERRISEEYKKTDNKEYFFYDLAELDETEGTGLFKAIYAAAEKAGDTEFTGEYNQVGEHP